MHQLADKSVAQILSDQRPSPGNMYFSNNRASAADLEEEFTNRLKESGSKITSRTIIHASKTFDEIIIQDAHFGTLLNKIKKAYDAYIRSKWGELQSDNDMPSYAELRAKLKSWENIISDKNSHVKKLENELLNVRAEKEKFYLEERQTKDSIIHDLKNRIDALNKQLTEVKKENEDLRCKAEQNEDEIDKDQEIRNLIHDNTILNDEWLRLRDQWDYLIMKENKLRYFYDTLNTAVYPVQEMYNNTVKNTQTQRFYEFLENNKGQYPNYEHHPYEMGQMMHPDDQYMNQGYNPEDKNPHHQPEPEPEPIKKSDISFTSQDSYEPLPIPDIKIPPRPTIVPGLCLDDLPEYETSSEEDNDPQYQNVPYQNGYNYIDNFYK